MTMYKVVGKTYDFKSTLKEVGFNWDADLKAWVGNEEAKNELESLSTQRRYWVLMERFNINVVKVDTKGSASFKVTGNSYEMRFTLKECGFRWDGKAWIGTEENKNIFEDLKATNRKIAALIEKHEIGFQAVEFDGNSEFN